MAETPETNKPDFRNGFPIRGLRYGSMISDQADGEELVLGSRRFRSSLALHARDCTVVYKKGGRTLATVTISRELQSLQAEAAMEAEIRS